MIKKTSITLIGFILILLLFCSTSFAYYRDDIDNDGYVEVITVSYGINGNIVEIDHGTYTNSYNVEFGSTFVFNFKKTIDLDGDSFKEVILTGYHKLSLSSWDYQIIIVNDKTGTVQHVTPDDAEPQYSIEGYANTNNVPGAEIIIKAWDYNGYWDSNFKIEIYDYINNVTRSYPKSNLPDEGLTVARINNDLYPLVDAAAVCYTYRDNEWSDVNSPLKNSPFLHKTIEPSA
jgi:hypothetical protein